MAENKEEEVVTEEAPKAEEASKPVNKDFIRVAGGKLATSLDISGMRSDLPDFKVGDTVEIHYKIREGDKQRVQLYTGNVISIRGAGLGKSFMVRRIAHEVGVERIFPYHSPMIDKIKVVRKGQVRRAKLYYLRDKSGKAGRIKEVVNYAAEAKRAEKKAAKTAEKKTAPKKEVVEASAE